MTKTYLPVKIDKGEGPPLVLLHGLGNNYKSWLFVLKKLNFTRHRVIVLDLLGFGDAPKPKNIAYSPQDHAEAVIKTLDSLTVNNAIIAGHSMGCLVAIEIAKQRPDIAKQLVLFGAPIYEKSPKSTSWSRLRKAEGIYFTIFSIVKENPDAVQAGGTIANELVPFVKGMEITEETWPAYRESLKHTIMQFQSFKDACKLAVPTLFVNGIFDLFIIKKNIKAIAKKNKKYVRVKSTLGPHEITPLQGRQIARLLAKVAQS